MIHLDDMALFVEVVKAMSFRRAAEALGMPNSTLSRRIGELEKAIGLRLLHRTTRRIELTESGRIYFERCKRIVEDARLAHEQLGDILAQPAGVLRASLRASDFIGRTGGEEFLLLLPETPLPAALEVADKVRAALHAQPEATAGLLSLSAGVSEAQLAHLDADVAVREADQALYRAKRAGRNRVEASSHADPAGGDQPR